MTAYFGAIQLECGWQLCQQRQAAQGRFGMSRRRWLQFWSNIIQVATL